MYLDPPFNSNQNYNVLFAEHDAKSAAQIKAFEDTWQWDETAVPTGIPSEIRVLTGNSDAEILRLDSMARDGIEPRIQGLRWRAINLTTRR